MSDNQADAVVFVKEAFAAAAQAAQTTKGKDDLVIWGGEFPEADLTAFLSKWSKALPHFTWHMVEAVDRFHVAKNVSGATYTPALIERLRLFGSQGDLDICRDEFTFHWRFIGAADQTWPDLALFLKKEGIYFDIYPNKTFHTVTKQYYQWRQQDERVSDKWSTDTGLPGENVYLQQEHYLENGRIAFVRYVGFEEQVS